MTIVEPHPTSQRAPWAKQRILETASQLFYQEGIRLVGVDRLISASEVTKATFYKHYRAKSNLVIAYVNARHERDKDFVENLIRESAGAKEVMTQLVSLIVTEMQKPNFRGCLYLNAAAEYPDASHPIRELVVKHRDWYTATIEGLLSQMGHPFPGDGADDFIVARDGAMSGAYAGDAIAATNAFERAVTAVLSKATA